ncbi:MAG: hypothetical protein DMF61_08710 [Blastocatellia bacterium AA13]|nr:MAG: hypothetical protein DMF61_08710 [Blastocatellia bacterium AA13]
MRYGVIPEGISERVALLLGRVPVPVIDSLYGIIRSRSLMAAVTLGVFEAIGRERRSVNVLAKRLSLDEECLDLLLRVLVHSGYLTKKGESYALSTLGLRTMLPESDQELIAFMRWNYTQWTFVERMEELISTGHGLDFHAVMKERGDWENYQRAMLELARVDAGTLARLVPVPKSAKRILDLGGSHGLLSAALCRKHPPMKSVVIDLPEAIGTARELARAEGIDDIVEHRGGDLLNDDLGSGYEAALLSNVLHHFRPNAIAKISRRVRDALTPGGILAIWEIEAPNKTDGATGTDAAALYFRLTSSARAYHGNDYRKWLKAAGFSNVSIKRPRLCPGYILVLGTV